ncbi:MAG TPA: hypothetical protein VNL13_07815 [Sulfolobales archaeon]|nr:hypothetical protein [Sulfolobales archaeon]
MKTQREVVSVHDEAWDVVKKIYRFVRVLKVLEKRSLYTRELLSIMNSWGETFELLKEMNRLGLIERYKDRCGETVNKICVYNRVTSKGREFLSLIDRVLEIINEGR